MLDELMVATQHLIGWEEGAAELARLRRLADVGAKNAHTTRGARGVVFCTICHKSGLGIGITAPKHAHDCDAAIHLGLERESET